MKILGLDVGTKTIGIAISDAFGWTAQGLKTIRRNESNEAEDFKQIVSLIEEHAVQTVVVGYPKNMDGTIGASGQRSEQFVAQLSEYVAIHTELWDERLTTMAAERVLVDADVSRKKRKKVIDQMAARLILQGYLDRRSYTK
ncbi:Holliday junction resolvase RuvX [Shouchella lehensis]|uniref:Putative pre-16S rRNA nuclease n=2 Tax=Shouchella lehensis TaxID=300825 RepID=A0A060LUW7_9BACI|nr:Holliday junction resolvase RuvX [Shouchella lehensis]AIC93992.1 Holliday junction resolvase [Shouchella lehensis G1]MBG9785584.1 Holliday junction resolvase [Shouchella lehensis]RQW19842.1 Holliday junction resolvase RuvX [Bacillus sp. C1-1]TES48029.1 Holliday junction resolvase RuvX [Shouchella lehensis]